MIGEQRRASIPRADDRGIDQLPGWRRRASDRRGLADCTLIVPTYRRAKELLVLLRALVALPDPPAEVVVVDGSPDGVTAALLRQFIAEELPFDLLYIQSPAGLTRQRNVGIDVSEGAFVFFLDDDCVPCPGYFREIRRVFLEDDAGKVGAITGLIVNEAGQLSLRWRLRFLLGLAPHVEPGIYDPSGTSVPRSTASPFEGVREVDILAGGASSFRRSVLEMHRFSTFFDGYSQGEDLEMSLRVRQNWRILWCASARVYHNPAPGRPTGWRKGYMEVRNRCFIRNRHPAGARFRDHLRFWLDIAFLIAMDIASVARWPWRTEHLSHAYGLVRGIVTCVVSPPHYDEPPARKRYELRIETRSMDVASNT